MSVRTPKKSGMQGIRHLYVVVVVAKTAQEPWILAAPDPSARIPAGVYRGATCNVNTGPFRPDRILRSV